ncbi:MAG: biopolymer transporter ExbD [Candidatus Cloacimonadota bacterium]|nr:MAG: biopolymer transporter ExbD [Candidatus Cloacimonadota bacterium]
MRKRREPLTADLTPLIDVVFLLLIFFLVSSVFKKEELALLLNLPETENFDENVQKQEMTIELSESDIALNGENISFEVLDSKCALIRRKTRPIIVRIDEEVTYKRVSKLFDLLQKYNLNNLMLVAKNNRESL